MSAPPAGAADVIETPASVSAPAGAPVATVYQPALDGIRGIAVAIVVVFHLFSIPGAPILGGGWLGVDMFFVLSGYLITSLLLAEHHRTGRVSLRRFYARRLLRLAPLSIVLVVVCFAASQLHLTQSTGLRLTGRGAISILFYFSNFFAVNRGSLLGSLGHCWSLSIEEQFYLVWPSVVLGFIWLSRRRSRALVAGFTIALILTQWVIRRHLWLTSLHTWNAAPNGGPSSDVSLVHAWNSFYVSSFQRPDGLLIGCLLAIGLHGRAFSALGRRLISVWGLVGSVVGILIVKHAGFALWTPWIPFIPAWGLAVFNVSVAGVVAYLVIAQQSLAARLLSCRPLCWIGRRAYGIYLIHPILIGAVLVRPSFTGIAPAAVVVVGTLVLAAASYRWLEKPFLRRKERFGSAQSPPGT